MPIKPSVLIIEDDTDIRELLEYNLSSYGFHCVSEESGEAGLRRIRQSPVDLILLDIMLPGENGIEILKRIKSDDRLKATPVVMVSAKSQESDVVLGLELGADDYIAKPFSPSELIARIKSVLRRTLYKDDTHEPQVSLGPLRIDPLRYDVFLESKKLSLTLTEFKIVYALAKSPGVAFTREQLLSKINNDQTFVIDRNIDVHVRAIRRKLNDHANLITTVRGIGYKACEAY